MTTPQVSAQVAAKSSEMGLLLEVILQPATGNPTGSRVFDDGRYEFLSDHEIIVASDGSSTRQNLELKWREVFVFTTSELIALKKAIADADFDSLNAVYSAPGQTFNTSTMTWRVWVNGQIKQVVVEGYPINKVPALEHLYIQFNQIHQNPAASSVWQVWTSSGVVKRTFDCDVSSVNFLRPVLQALFAPIENGTGTALTLKPETVILEIAWKEAGQEVERTRLYADGRYVEIVQGSESLVKTLSKTQLGIFFTALQAISWNQLPEPVCEQPQIN